VLSDDEFADLATLLSQCLPDEVLVEGVPLDMCWWDAAGNMYLCDDADDWVPIEVADAGVCEHEETICSACLAPWSQDWALRAVAV
jgi:hypothetical protein